MKTFKRIISVALALTIMLSSVSLEAMAVGGETVPGTETGNPGSEGNWGAPGILVKFDFYSPKIYGLTRDNWNKFENPEWGRSPTDQLYAESLDQRALFERGTRTPVMPKMDAFWGGTDSGSNAQMYVMATEANYNIGGDSLNAKGFNQAKMLIDRGNIYTTQAATNMWPVVGSKVQGALTADITSDTSILSINNTYVKALMAVTEDGAKWKGQEISDAITALWEKYVDPDSASFGADGTMTYRQQFTRIFSSDKNLELGLARIQQLLGNSVIKPGYVLPSGKVIKDDVQAANIKNFVLAGLGLVLANPLGGLTVHDGTKNVNISKELTYKPVTVLQNLQNWARNGGNSNVNENGDHFAIRLDLYGSQQNSYHRWDMSMYNSLIGANRDSLVTPVGYTKPANDASLYGYSTNYTYSNHSTLFKQSLEAAVKAHKEIGLTPSINPKDSSNGWKYTSMQSYFHNPQIMSNGVVRSNLANQNKSMAHRGLVVFKSPVYFQGTRAINMGFGWISAGGPNPVPINGDAATPNMKMDSEAFTDVVDIPKDEKASVTSYTGLAFPLNELSTDTVKTYKLFTKNKTNISEWNTWDEEVNAMISLIERCSIPQQLVNPNDANARLPVQLTITRTIENGKAGGNKSNKIFDDDFLQTTTVAKCGGTGAANNHNFKIADVPGSNKAIVTFNIIPKPGSSCGKDFEFSRISQYKSRGGGGNTVAEGDASIYRVENCVLKHLVAYAWSRIKFTDKDIEVTDTVGGKTTVNYDFSYTMKTPAFKEDLAAYGDAATDRVRSKSTYDGVGYAKLPEAGVTYPYSDWFNDNGNFRMNSKIRRSVTFTRLGDNPSYTNLGFEDKTPFYSEIKEGSPSNETFEAMSGMPTSSNLYMSVGGTDFKVDFSAAGTAKVNPATKRTYTYTETVTNCWGAETPCTIGCSGHSVTSGSGACLVSAEVPSSGTPGKPGYNPGKPAVYCSSTTANGVCTGGTITLTAKCSKGSCTVSQTFTPTYKPGDHKGNVKGYGCTHADNENSQHPLTHVYTYTLDIPIESFTYFDMLNTEVWRLSQWGLKGHENFLTNPSPTKITNTKIQGFNNTDYVSGNGRLIFSNAQTGNTQGTAAKLGDNTRSMTLSHGAPSCLAGATKAMQAVNTQVKALPTFKTSVVSDYLVLHTSEGLQTPYFYSQELSTCSPSAANFTEPTGGTITLPTAIKAPKQLTIDDFWWKNTNLKTCASKDNGWQNTSITFGGYNGGYTNLETKYLNQAHQKFINTENPINKLLQSYGITGSLPNEVKEGNATTISGTGKDNAEHIMTGLDIINTTPNGEKNTGKAWVRYDRVMFYQQNADKGVTSAEVGRFPMTTPGVWTNNNVIYAKGMEKINDIVIHNPVSAQNAIVISNDPKYDDRTNAALMQGGDPSGLAGGVCPIFGCQFSELTCTKTLTQHITSCYQEIVDTEVHVGGENAHDHTPDCNHTHTAACEPPDCGYAIGWCACFNCHGYHDSSCGNYGVITTFACGEVSHTHTGSKHVGLKQERRLDYASTGTDFYSFTATSDGSLTFKSTDKGRDPRGRVYVNEGLISDNDDSNGSLNFLCTAAFKKGDRIRTNVYQFGSSGGSWAYCVLEVNQKAYICGKPENVCTGIPNKHACTAACETTYKKTLVCTDPHHYTPGEPTDVDSPNSHYPIGDSRCWKRCGNNANHGDSSSVTLPDGTKAELGGTFINLDREFKIFFPFSGDFAKDVTIEGIGETTDVNGKGYTNNMNTSQWTAHRWVRFPVNVIDQNGHMILAWSQIDLNNYSTTATEFTFYCSLSNKEMTKSEVKFTAVANNAPTADTDEYTDESIGSTNIDRVDWKYAARHTAHKLQDIDVIGSIGSLTINDTGDYRFSNLFKKAKDTTGNKNWLVPNLVPEVFLNIPNLVVSDQKDVRKEAITKENQWLDTYGNMNNSSGGKSGGTGNLKQPLALPLVPRLNPIASLQNQPMRPGYQLYMDAETIGNYYGETVDQVTGNLIDKDMVTKMQIRPVYYSYNVNTKVYTPVDVYYGVNGEYMKVNTYKYTGTESDTVGVQDYYYYLDWLNESARRNNTTAENNATKDALSYHAEFDFYEDDKKLRSPNAQRDVIGSANVIFLNDLNRTFIGSSITNGIDKNEENRLPEASFNVQSQRWQFTLGLPSSAVFIEAGKPCTETNIRTLQSKDRVIICALDIKVLGEVWTLQYDGSAINNNIKIYPGDTTNLIPPKFDENGKPTNDPKKDVTSKNPIVVIYPPDKTSKDDVISGGIQ